MDFPRLLYRCPGPHKKHGHTYALRGCNNIEEFRHFAEQGWFASYEEAIVGNHMADVIDAVEAADAAIDEITPATRDEMEQKAKELGLKFNSRTPDKTLAQRIADAV